MTRPGTSREFSRLLNVVLTVLIIAVLYLAKTVVVPLGLAVLFAFLFSPVVTLLERIRLPRILAIVFVILTAGTIVGIGGWTVFRQLVDVTAHLPAYTLNINQKVETLHPGKETSFTRAQKEIERLSEKFGALSPGATSALQQSRTRELGASPNRPLSVREVGDKSGRLDTVHGVLGAMVSVLLVVVFTFFILLQREDLRDRLIRLSGRGHLNLMTQAMDEAAHRVSRYLSLQLLVNTCYGAIIFTVLHFIGLPHAILWGALAGILRFIPYIGAPIAALLPTAFSLAVFSGWTQTLLIMALFFCVEVATANFIEPHVYGKHTGLSPLAILVAALFWTLIWGPIGLILSVPLTVCLVVVGAHVPSLEFLIVLLGDQPVMRPEAHYYQRLLASDEHEASQALETYLKDHSLENLYDSVLIPALNLSEQDRHRNALDEATVRFITETTKELVEELGLRTDEQQSSDTAIQANWNGSLPVKEEKVITPSDLVAKKTVCIPVRDDADEIVATMLTQLLERAGHSAKTISPWSSNGMLAELLRTEPDVIYLSALPPYAISYAQRIYRSLRAQDPKVEIVIGLWNYAGDPEKAAKKISRGEQDHVCTTLAQAVTQAGPAALAIAAPEASSSDYSVVGA